MDEIEFLGVVPPPPAWQDGVPSILIKLGPRFEEPEKAEELQIQLVDAFFALTREVGENEAVAVDLADLEHLTEPRLIAHAILAAMEHGSYVNLIYESLTEREWGLVDRHLEELTRLEDF